ncbi:MAG TPA: hypothetical protein VLL54_15800 [Pyrinomonadaceae bacterium]|nr:hypothetical protein [Pyrinomonadaceae bacterium]
MKRNGGCGDQRRHENSKHPHHDSTGNIVRAAYKYKNVGFCSTIKSAVVKAQPGSPAWPRLLLSGEKKFFDRLSNSVWPFDYMGEGRAIGPPKN